MNACGGDSPHVVSVLLGKAPLVYKTRPSNVFVNRCRHMTEEDPMELGPAKIN